MHLRTIPRKQGADMNHRFLMSALLVVSIPFHINASSYEQLQHARGSLVRTQLPFLEKQIRQLTHALHLPHKQLHAKLAMLIQNEQAIIDAYHKKIKPNIAFLANTDADLQPLIAQTTATQDTQQFKQHVQEQLKKLHALVKNRICELNNPIAWLANALELGAHSKWQS